MTAWVSRFPISLDPLMKEAKRRMRQRRLLIAVAVLLLAGGAAGATLALRGSPHRSAAAPTPAQLRMSPLSNLAARMAFCGNTRAGCESPDGKWSIVFVNRSAGPVSYNYSNGQVSGYNPPPVGCTLMVDNLAGGGREQIHVREPACDHGVWLGHTYVFEDPLFAPGARLLSLDLPSRKVRVLAHLGSDVVSPDGHWIAGEAELPPVRCGAALPCHYGPWLVAVVSPETGICRVVTQQQSLAPGFGGPAQSVGVGRNPWEFARLFPSGYKDPVVWNDAVQGGTNIQVVSGPGTGFTRDSRSIIVATWQYRMRPVLKAGPTHMRLLKFDLSSLHTPCPAGVR
jgi:hypothetical protein